MYILVGSRQYILTDRLVASIVLLHLQEARLYFAASIVLLQRPDGAFAVALSCFVSGISVTWIEQMLASSDVMQPLRQAYVASGLGQGLRHLMHFRQNNGFGNRPRERPERPWSHRKCPSGDPGAFWSMSAASGRCPGDLRGTPEAAPKPPSTAPGVPQDAQGTPKDAAEAPRAASDWLFLVAKGLLNSSPALLQKSTFSYVNSMILEGSGPPES